jgi:RNA polymerase sigma-54 factor
MKPSLQLKFNQHLALTPQLQQSIRLLQLSTLELNQELEQVLADNPLLERIDDPLQDCLRIRPDGGLDGFSQPDLVPGLSTGGGEGLIGAGGEGISGDTDGADGSDYGGLRELDTSGRDGGDGALLDWGGEGGSRSRTDDGDDEREWPQLAAGSVSLREHLLTQLRSTHGSVRDRALVTVLIDELSDDGLLGTPLEEVAASLPAELEVEAQELAAALKLLQSFDPAGVGARNLAECLVLQLDSPAFENHPASVRRVAREIAARHLETLAARDYVRLRRVLHCDEEVLRQAQALIRQLNPRPGSAFGGDEPSYVVPDIVVRRTRQGWVATLNGDALPKLRINDMYAQILKRNRGANSALSGQLQEARWLVKNVQQRFDTILRVSQAIVDRQQAFFSHGAVAMRPLVLREIADTLGLHESTVSRVTTQKYMLTPLGVFELKYFFGSHVGTDTGGAASSTAIRAMIRQLVEAEDAKRPLSDSRIAELLGEQGFVVARRTVAKYREALRIPAVAQRRAL